MLPRSRFLGCPQQFSAPLPTGSVALMICSPSTAPAALELQPGGSGTTDWGHSEHPALGGGFQGFARQLLPLRAHLSGSVQPFPASNTRKSPAHKHCLAGHRIYPTEFPLGSAGDRSSISMGCNRVIKDCTAMHKDFMFTRQE